MTASMECDRLNRERAEREGRSIAPLITRLNALRKAHPALRRLRNLRFHHVDQPELICFSKHLPAAGSGKAEPQPDPVPTDTAPADTVLGDTVPADTALGDTVLTVVNLDPHQAHEATVYLDLPSLGLDWAEEFVVTDELSGDSYQWRQANYVRLDPHDQPAHILTLRRSDS